MSSLENRIAAVIHRESNYHRVYCAIDPAYCVVGPRDHVGAAAVVAELGLTQQERPVFHGHGDWRVEQRVASPWRSASLSAASPVEVTPE